MSETKPTPGPWHVNESTASVWSKNQLIATTLNEGFNHQYHPVVANANLIAASPEMLESLKHLVDCFDNIGGGPIFIMAKAKKVIKKAEGEKL